MLIPEEKELTEEQDAHRNLSPPSYFQASSPSPSTAGSSTPTVTSTTSTLTGESWHPSEIISHLLSTFITPPANYVYVSEKNNSIKGSWTIDTALSPPPAFLAPIEKAEDGERKNLYVQSTNGSLNVKVRLISSQDVVRRRAALYCASANGNVQVYVLPRSSQAFHLVARSANGSIRVYLPRDFNGPIEHHTKNGTTVFSPGIRPNVQTFSSTRGEGKSFVGDWYTTQSGRSASKIDDGSEIESASDWTGDHLVISSNNGSLYIQYVDEEKLEPAFVKTIKGWFHSNAETKQLLGEANRIMKDGIGGRRHY